jgi:hypothetical protein
MAVATGIYVVRDAVFTLATVAYPNQVTSARLVPDTPIQVLRTLVPDGAITDVDSPVWTLELTLAQKNNTGGLAKALRALEPGATAACVLAPKDLDGEDTAAFNILAIPPPFGGQQGAFPTAEMVFPVVGQPVFTVIDEGA